MWQEVSYIWHEVSYVTTGCQYQNKFCLHTLLSYYADNWLDSARHWRVSSLAVFDQQEAGHIEKINVVYGQFLLWL